MSVPSLAQATSHFLTLFHGLLGQKDIEKVLYYWITQNITFTWRVIYLIHLHSAPMPKAKQRADHGFFFSLCSKKDGFFASPYVFDFDALCSLCSPLHFSFFCDFMIFQDLWGRNYWLLTCEGSHRIWLWRCWSWDGLHRWVWMSTLTSWFYYQ